MEMTNVLPDREVLTQPIAHRRYTTTTYDINATAFLRPGEAPIFLGSPTDAWITTGEIRTGDPVHAAEWSRLDDMLQDPPTGPVPPLPPPPPTPAKAACACCWYEVTPHGEHGRRRRPARRVSPWTGVAIAVAGGLAMWAGLTLAAGWVLG
jgi:hypothetical protein